MPAEIEQPTPADVVIVEDSEQGDEGVKEDVDNMRTCGKKRRASIGSGAKGKQPAKRLKSISS